MLGFFHQTNNIVIISFCNEAQSIYHTSPLQPTIGDPTSAYKNDYDKFVGTNHNGNNPSNSSVYNTYKSFFGVHYPIVFGTNSSDCNGGSSAGIVASKEFLSHSIAAALILTGYLEHLYFKKNTGS